MSGSSAHGASRVQRLKHRLFIILEAGKTRDLPSTIFDMTMVALILANVLAVVLETVPEVEARYGPALRVFDVVSVTIFLIEYLLRLWVCTEHLDLKARNPVSARLRFAATPYMIVDLLAILPSLLAAFIPLDLRFLRVFRLIRFLMLARFSPALATLGRVLATERRALYGSLIIMAGALLLAASVMYFAEGDAQPEHFGTIPKALWWSVATLTTVGYGDVVPVTPFGKVIAGFVMIVGLGMFALPIGIIATGFAQEIHRNQFVVTWGLVARVPLFSALDARSIAEVMGLLRTRIVPQGTVIVHRGDPADGMYFISVGEVEVVLEDRRLTLGEGEFFGEVALLRNVAREADVRALTTVHLLILDAADFRHLMARKPQLAERVRKVAEDRYSALHRRLESATGDLLPDEVDKAE